MKVWGVRYILIYRCSLYKFLVLLWIKIINLEEKGGGQSQLLMVVFIMSMTYYLYYLLGLMVFSMSTCAYVYLRSRKTMIISLGLSKSRSTYCFTLSWKVLNWSFMIHCSATVPSTDRTDGTSLVKFARDLFPGWLFLLIPFFVVYAYTVSFFSLTGCGGIGIWITPRWALICGGHGIFDQKSFLYFWLFIPFDYSCGFFLWNGHHCIPTFLGAITVVFLSNIWYKTVIYH